MFDSDQSDLAENYVCRHWRPSYWEAKGYKRNWGDAAVMNWPHLEILRGEFRDSREPDAEPQVRFVILAPFTMRRPVVLTDCGPRAWGAY